MKPLVKICIAFSVILFFLGIACIGIGMALGVTPSQLLYSGHLPGRFFLRPRLEIGNLDDSIQHGFSDELDDLPEADLPDSSDLPSLSGENPFGAEEYYEFSGEDIQSFNMDLTLCELHILTHQEDHIAVCADNVQNYFHCSQEGRKLIFQDTRKAPLTGSSMDQALRLDLYLPEQEYEEFSIDMGTGNITLDLLSASSVEIDQGVGEITIGSLTCKDLEADTGVGEFLADSLQISGETDIDVGTGNITVRKYDGKSLTLDCGAGNAEITAAGSESDYNYKLEAALGNIYLNHHQQEHGGGHHGSRHDDDDYCLDIRHGAGREIEIMCALGNAELNFTEE